MNIHDVRARYTRKVIREEFLKLLNTKPVAKISVTELCNACSINRTTFYKHYEDIYALLHEIEDEMINHLKEISEEAEQGDLEDMFTHIFTGAKQYGMEWLVMFSENGDPSLIPRFRGFMHDRFYDQFMEIPMPVSDEVKSYTYDFMMGGTTAIISSWIRSGMKDDPEEMAKICAGFIRSLV